MLNVYYLMYRIQHNHSKVTRLYTVDSNEDGYELCKKILNDGDCDYEERMRLINNFLPEADGNIGERVTIKLISDLLNE